jgi:hypothetical protein
MTRIVSAAAFAWVTLFVAWVVLLSTNAGRGYGPVPAVPAVLSQLDALAARASALEAGEYGCRPAARRLHAAEDALALARTRAERRHAAQEWMRARHGLRRAVR